ncbi:MAG TPA: ATP-binding cassette domain-containing protein [Caldisericia bacterium]|nr:ATP-binding cassette domain-containing protein [Caldisericia bacterium]
MVEREIKASIQKKEIKNGEIILSVKDLFVKNDKGRTVVKGVNFEVKEYEIFGIAGVSGNGQKELIEALTGLRKWEKGEVQFFGKKYDRFSSKLFRRLNISHIPEERTKFGVVANLPIYDNSVLRTYDNCNFCRGLILRYNNIKDFSKKIIKEYNVMAPSINTRIKFLSGGNIQKFILGREISTKKDFIIAAHPTYGLDISATRDIRDLLIKMRDEGSGILLVSEDLDEILEISDRFAIMYDGEFIEITKPGELSIEEIGLMLGGLKSKNREERLS